MKRYANNLSFVEVPPGITSIIEKRVAQLLPALKVYDYDLRKVLACAYFQGINDGLEVIVKAEREGKLTITMDEALSDNG